MKRSRVLIVLLTVWLLALAAIAVEGAKEANRKSQFFGSAEGSSRK